MNGASDHQLKDSVHLSKRKCLRNEGDQYGVRRLNFTQRATADCSLLLVDD